MILNMNMPTDWKELLEYWPIMRSLLGTTGSEGCRRRRPPPRVRTVHGIMVKTWSCCCLEFNQCNLLVSDNQIYTPRIVAFLWHHGWVCSWGPRGDSRVDHVIVTGQWSRYIALPEISLIGPIPRSHRIQHWRVHTTRACVGPWTAGSETVVLEKSQSTCWCSLTLSTSSQERQWGRA